MIARVCVHVDVFRTLVPPAILCTVDQRMLIIGLVHTLDATAYTKPGTVASHALLACPSHSPAGTASRDRFPDESRMRLCWIFLLIDLGGMARGVTLLLRRRGNRRGLACTTPSRARARRRSRAADRARAREHRARPLVRGNLRRCQQRATATVAVAEWEVRDCIRGRRSKSLVPVYGNDTRLRGGSARGHLGGGRPIYALP